MNGRTMRRGEATVVDFWAPLRRSTAFTRATTTRELNGLAM